MSIIQGVPAEVPYKDPPAAGGGRAIAVTKDRAMLVSLSGRTTEEILLSIEELLRHIRLELMLTNEKMFTQERFDNERNDADRLYNDPRAIFSNADPEVGLLYQP